MYDKMRHLIPLTALSLLLALPACSFDGVPEVAPLCEIDTDCEAYERCIEGRCALATPSSTTDADLPDMSVLDAATADAPHDADLPAEMPVICTTDRDGDGFFEDPTCPDALRDCDPTDELVYPGAPRRCNGRDNDCDQLIDREACECQAGTTEPCGTDEGACIAGQRRCINGTWGECEGFVGATMEICDGEDNDCDGRTDETYLDPGGSCDTSLEGICARGKRQCVNGEVSCVQLSAASPETCDAQDNDCDGDVDEAADGLVLSESCGPTNQCAAPQGVRLCILGAWSGCATRDVELCDGTDTNCDGLVDNRSRCVVACGADALPGTLACTPQGATCTLPDEICGDGRDNDCDGAIDNGCQPAQPLRNMAYIPGGTFVMGSQTSDIFGQPDEYPAHIVDLSPYYMDRYEVTRSQYTACVNAGVCASPQVSGDCPATQSLMGADASKPIACVRWRDADTYCQWVGKRLPTEAEWEKAARGPFNRIPLWPWGDQIDARRAVASCVGDLDACLDVVDGRASGRSAYGMHHMAGNIAEFVADFYASNAYAALPSTDPEQTTNINAGHVIRGGSWRQQLRFARTANRASEIANNLQYVDVGFRCAQGAP